MGLYPKVQVNSPSGLPEHPNASIFYVNSQEGTNRALFKQGTKPSRPWETVTYALAQCVDEENDVIFVTTPVQVEAQPIVVDKGAVQIRGLPINTPGYAQQARTWFFPDAHVTGGVFTLSQSDILIKDFMFWSTAGQPCIDFGGAHATNVRNVIDQCSFHVGSRGIQTGPGVNLPAHYLSILRCMFHEQLSVGGILLASNGSWPLIADCFFESIPMPNISLTANIAGGRILRNQFVLPADSTVGGAIDLANGSRFVIADNDANDATPTALSNNPYRDTPNAHTWFRNTVGGVGFTEVAPA